MPATRSEKDKSAILAEAKQRHTRAMAWESTARARGIEDEKFAEGDSDNLYQWPDDIRQGRIDGDRPMLTLNQVRQLCLDILNDARQSKVAISIKPTGEGATLKSAEVYEGVVRHIEYQSNAGAAYQHGLRFAVHSGIGWWRVVSDYAGDDTFDQDLFIRRVKDPNSIILDPDIKEFDGSDAMFGFVFTDMPRDEFDRAYPKWKGRVGDVTLGGETWFKEGSVRVAEYFRRVPAGDFLWAWPDLESDPSGQTMTTALESELEKGLVTALKRMAGAQRRAVKSLKVEWFKLVGDEIAEEREWLGIYIPLIRCVGEETVIQGQYDRKGHVRAIKDAQRMFNYNASGAVEYGALQNKAPYITPADAIEGMETFWDNANRENYPYLPWNHVDDQGQPIPPPQRQAPPTGAPIYMQGMMDAAEQMRMVSGQYQSDLGAPSNERSGVAIMQRQRQGDNATYHYLDHQAAAIRFTGKILIDLIPKYYDTRRVRKIMAEDGTENEVVIDPNAPKPLQERKTGADAVETIFNPNVGKYDVVADVGPAFATRRQEAFNAYTQILAQNPDLTAIIGDLALRFADFPGAEEAAQRLKRMVPKQALEDGPSPDVLALQQQIEAMQNLVKQLAGKLADKTMDALSAQEKNAISAYDSITKRVTAIKEHLAADPEGLAKLVMEVIEEADATSAHGALGPGLTIDAPAPLEAAQAQQAPGAPGQPQGPSAQGPEAAPEPTVAEEGVAPIADPGGPPVA